MQMAETAPVRHEKALRLPPNLSAQLRARLFARERLTLMGWPGDQHKAIDVMDALVHNAVRHAIKPGQKGQRLSVRLAVTEADELIIDVTDSRPAFPNWEEAVRGELGRGLWLIQQQGAQLSKFLVGPRNRAKTVRAVLRPGAVDL
jgi:anti-sigma regulatory factor (Ser/Thr protein kinase)